jgi:carbon-monoxide dehydrogenase medium subunit
VRIALGGVADSPVLAEAAGQALVGTELADADLEAAAQAALEVVDPPTDVRATAEYRRHLVPVYVRRVLTELRATGAR